jgi:5-formyltetrahydrofolate cyclo-ligase
MPPAAIAERSARIVERLTALSAFEAARAVALFWPISARREVDLRPLDDALRTRGVRVAYPAIDETGEMAFRFVADVDAMVDDPLGFRAPTADDPAASPDEIDLVVVPALAVDPRGHRIGYGAGHYDRALPRFTPQDRRIAVAFDFQLVAEVPDTIGDAPVGVIVTDRRTLLVEVDSGAGAGS